MSIVYDVQVNGKVTACDIVGAWQSSNSAKTRYILCAPHQPVQSATPRSKIGLYAVGNLQLLCDTCNIVEGNRSMEYLRTQLRQRGMG